MVETVRTALLASPPRARPGKSFIDADLFPWEHFVARSGDEGSRWVADYVQAGCDKLKEQTEQAVHLLRSRQIQEGGDLLAETWATIRRIAPDRPDLRAVTNRWYFTAIAYYHYVIADFESAAADVNLAQEALETAIRAAPIILPFAHHRVGIQILHLAIARDQRRWDQMRHHVEIIRQLSDDLLPLCRLEDGAPIYFATIDRYIRALPSLSLEESRFVDGLFNKEYRRRHMGSLLRQFYALPGLVIPDP
jgi:hypothetical protein